MRWTATAWPRAASGVADAVDSIQALVLVHLEPGVTPCRRRPPDGAGARGYTLVHAVKTEPWGQTIARFMSPEGLLIGVCHTPWHHERKKSA